MLVTMVFIICLFTMIIAQLTVQYSFQLKFIKIMHLHEKVKVFISANSQNAQVLPQSKSLSCKSSFRCKTQFVLMRHNYVECLFSPSELLFGDLTKREILATSVPTPIRLPAPSLVCLI